MQIHVIGVKRIFSIISIVLLLCSSLPVSTNAETRDSDAIPSGYVLAAENDNLELYYSTSIAAVIVQNKTTGHQWRTAMDDTSIPKGATQAQRREMKSLMHLSYTSVADFSSKTIENYLEGLEYSCSATRSADGFSYDIYIDKLDCIITLKFSLDDYGLKVEIPKDGIQEAVRSGERILDVRKEIEKDVDAQISAFETMKGSSRITDEDKKKIDISISCLEKTRDILAETTGPYGIRDKADEMSSLIDDMNKTGYRSNASMAIKLKIAQLEVAEASAIVSVDLMPYFGACDDSTDGFVLYPDGSGAITYFKKKHGEYKSRYNAYTYSRMYTNIDKELEQRTEGLINQTVPYYGIKSGKDGFIAYVCNGQAMSNVSFSPSGYVLPVSRASAGFTFRSETATSSVNGEWQSGSDTMVFESQLADYNPAIEFLFLQGDDADYSGMANALRNYLVKEQKLVKSGILSEKMPIAIDLLGAFNQKLLLLDRFQVATDFRQAKAVIDTLGGIPVLCNYKGVFEKGYGVYPAGWGINSRLGSEQELLELSGQIRDGGGMLFLGTNQLLADLEESDYSESDLTIGNQYTVIRSSGDNAKFLFSPQTVVERAVRLSRECENLGSAVSDDMLGRLVYADYSKGGRTSRIETVGLWQDVLKQNTEVLGASGVALGNDYSWSAVDWITDVPCGASGYSYTDEEIPFYELLTHGYIAETSICVNEYHDTRTQLLRSIEYGLVPYYSLSVDSANWDVEGCYSSRFNEVYDDLVSTYNECYGALCDVMDVPITGHRRKGNLVEVSYENGIRILINYSDKKIQVGDISVEPMNYVRISDGEEDIREKALSIRKIEYDAQGGEERVSVYSSMAVWVFAVLSISVVIFCCISIFKHKRS